MFRPPTPPNTTQYISHNLSFKRDEGQNDLRGRGGSLEDTALGADGISEEIGATMYGLVGDEEDDEELGLLVMQGREPPKLGEEGEQNPGAEGRPGRDKQMELQIEIENHRKLMEALLLEIKAKDEIIRQLEEKKSSGGGD